MKTHLRYFWDFDPGYESGITACGFVLPGSTTDTAADVTCRNCQRTERFTEAKGDQE